MLLVGNQAPEFSGVDGRGQVIRLSDFRGRKLILFFYPGDFTLFCTMEVCNLRDHYSELKEQGFELLGVSANSISSHKEFTDKHRLPFQLLSDLKKEVIQQYGAWGRKGFWKFFSFGVRRVTFVIDEFGIISYIIRNVKSSSHAEQLMKIFKRDVREKSPGLSNELLH